MWTGKHNVSVIDYIEYLANQANQTTAIKLLNQPGLNYKEFNSEINKRANFLLTEISLTHIVKRVGILNERSLETLLWMFALWKCGYSFLLLEPKELSSPTTLGRGTFNKIVQSDLSFIITSGVNIELFQKVIQKQQQKIKLLNDISINLMDNDKDHKFYDVYELKEADKVYPSRMINLNKINFDDYPSTNPPKINLFEDDNYPSDGKEAYVIFTSGSTGRPKGCLIHHGGLHNFFKSIGDTLKIKDSIDTSLWSTNIDFDPVIGVPCFTFICGGSLYIANDKELNNVEEFFKSCEQQQINIMLMVPTLAKNILGPAEKYLSQIRNLRMMFTGEKMDKDLLRSYGKIVIKNGGGIYNAYGPTEGPIGLTMTPVKIPVTDDEFSNAIISIGKAISGREYHLAKLHTDDQSPKIRVTTGDEYIPSVKASSNVEITIGELQDKDQEGEIIYSSSGFIGYLNDREATIKRRIKVNGKYYWRTGDKAQFIYLHDQKYCDYEGTPILKYIGRIDNQLKIAGVRIQPEGIEVLLEELKEYVSNARTIVLKQLKVSSQNTIQYQLPRIISFYVKKREDAHEILSSGLRQYLQNATGRSIPCHYLIPVDSLHNAGSPNGKFKNDEIIEKFKDKIINIVGIPTISQIKTLEVIYSGIKNIIKDIMSFEDNFIQKHKDAALGDLGISSLELILFKELLCESKLLADDYEKSAVIFDQYNKEFIQEGLSITDYSISKIAQLIYEFHDDKNILIKIKEGDWDYPIYFIINENQIKDKNITEFQQKICGLVPEQCPVYLIKSSNISQCNNDYIVAKRLSRIIKQSQQTGPYYVCGYYLSDKLLNQLSPLLNNLSEQRGLCCGVQEEYDDPKNVVSLSTINFYNLTQLKIIIIKQLDEDLQTSIAKKKLQIKKRYSELFRDKQQLNELGKKTITYILDKLTDTKIFFVIGRTGIGKSILIKQILKDFADRNDFFMIMVDVTVNLNNCLSHSLLQMGFTLAELEYLKKQKVVIVFNGLNKLSDSQVENIIIQNKLNEWHHSHFIISFDAKLHNSLFYRNAFTQHFNKNTDHIETIQLDRELMIRQQIHIDDYLKQWFLQQFDRYPAPIYFTKTQWLIYMYQYCHLLAANMKSDRRIKIDDLTTDQFYKQLDADIIKNKLDIPKYLFDLNDMITRYLFITAPIQRISIREGDFIEFIDEHVHAYFKAYIADPTALPIVEQHESHKVSINDRNLFENIRIYNIGASKQPLFLLPPISGEYAYKDLATLVVNSQPIYEFQHPALSSQNLIYTNIEEQVNYYAEAIHEIYPSGSISLVGWSFGGWLAVKVAKVLVSRFNREINYIGIVDTPGSLIWKDISINEYHAILIQRLAWIIDKGIIEKLDNSLHQDNLSSKEALKLILNQLLIEFRDINIISQLNEKTNNPSKVIQLTELTINKIISTLNQFIEKQKTSLAMTSSINQIIKIIKIILSNLTANIDPAFDITITEYNEHSNHIHFYLADRDDINYYKTFYSDNNQNIIGWPCDQLTKDRLKIIEGANHFTLLKDENYLRKLAMAVSEDLSYCQTPATKSHTNEIIKKICEHKLFEGCPQYIQSDCYLFDSKYRSPLIDEINIAITSVNRLIMLLGESGLGKTTFCKYFHDELSHKYLSEKSSYIPIYLISSDQPERTIRHYFIQQGFSIYQIDNVLKKDKFIFIFDSSDAGIYFDAKSYDAILKSWPNAKLILTMQPKYYSEVEEKKIVSTMVKVFITDFSNDQCEQYKQATLRSNIIVTFNNVVSDIPDEVLANPMTLSMLINLFNESQLNSELDKSFKALSSRTDVYNKFIENMIQKEWMTTKLRWEISQTIQENTMRKSAIEIAKLIALYMYRENKNFIKYNTFNKQILLFNPNIIHSAKALHYNLYQCEFVFSLPRIEIEFALRSLPISLQNNEIKFNHQSYLDYFFALALFDLLFNYFNDKTISCAHMINCHLNMIQITRNNSVLDFLVNLIKSSPHEESLLKYMINIAKSSIPQYRYQLSNLVSNFITVAVKVSPNIIANENLTGIYLQYADLSDCNLTRTCLEAASLKGTLMRRTLLNHTIINDADVTDVDFGILPSLIGHNGKILHISASSDGKFLASSSGNEMESFRIWDVNQYSCLKKINAGHIIKAISFIPNSSLLIVAGDDDCLMVWDVEKKEITKRYWGNFSNIALHGLSISINGKWLALAKQKNPQKVVLEFYDLSSEKFDIFWMHELDISDAHFNHYRLIFSHDSNKLIFIGTDTAMYLFDMNKQKLLHTIANKDRFFLGAVFSADNRHILTSSYYHPENTDKAGISFWDSTTGELKNFIDCTNKIDHCSRTLVIIPDKSWVAFNDRHGVIYLLDINQNKIIQTFHQHHSFILKLIIINSLKLLCSVGQDGIINIFPYEKIEHTLKHSKLQPAEVTTVCYNSISKTIISGLSDGSIQVRNSKTGALLKTLHKHDLDINVIVFSPSQTIFISASANGDLLLWDSKTLKFIAQLVKNKSMINAVIFLDDHHLMTGSLDGIIRCYDLNTRTCYKEIKHPNKAKLSSINCLAISSDQKYLLSGSNDGFITMWDFRNDRLIFECQSHTRSVSSVAFPCDEKSFASGGYDNCVNLYPFDKKEFDKENVNIQQLFQKRVNQFNLHFGEVSQVFYSSDGKQLISSSHDGFIYFWNIEQGTLDQEISGDNSPVSCIYSQDQNHIISGHLNGSIKFWELNTSPVSNKSDLNTENLNKKETSKLIWSINHDFSAENLKYKFENFSDNNSKLLEQHSKKEKGIESLRDALKKAHYSITSERINDMLSSTVKFLRTMQERQQIDRHVPVKEWLLKREAVVYCRNFLENSGNYEAALLWDKTGISNIFTERRVIEDQQFYNPVILSQRLLTYIKSNQLVKILYRHGVSLNQFISSSPCNSLHLAIYHRNLKLMHYLLNCGADPNFETKNDKITPIVIAINAGFLDGLILLQQYGATLNKATNLKLLPIYLSVIKGHVDIVRYLHKQGIDIHSISFQNRKLFLLHLAAINGHLSVVKYFLEQQMSVNQQDSNGDTALNLSIYHNHIDIADLLIKHGANGQLSNIKGGKPIASAVQKGHIELVKHFLQYERTVDGDLPNGITYLMVAISNRQEQVAKLLIDCGAKIKVVNASGISPWQLAFQQGFVDILNLILDKEPGYFTGDQLLFDIISRVLEMNKAKDSSDQNHREKTDAFLKRLILLMKNISFQYPQTKNTLLILFITYNRLNLVKQVCKPNNINLTNDEMLTPLMNAALENCTEIADYLLQRGANTTIQYKDGDTALLIAALRGFKSIVQLICRHDDSTINLPDLQGITPLIAAAQNGHTETVELLLQYKAKVNSATYKWKTTALITACEAGHLDAVSLIIAAHADLNQTNSEGATALHSAINRGQLHIVEKLLQHPIDLNKRTNKNQTPLFIAALYDHKEIFVKLLKKGAHLEINTSAAQDLLDLQLKMDVTANLIVFQCRRILEYLANNGYQNELKKLIEINFTFVSHLTLRKKAPELAMKTLQGLEIIIKISYVNNHIDASAFLQYYLKIISLYSHYTDTNKIIAILEKIKLLVNSKEVERHPVSIQIYKELTKWQENPSLINQVRDSTVLTINSQIVSTNVLTSVNQDDSEEDDDTTQEISNSRNKRP